MPDIENVVKGLELCINSNEDMECSRDCPYYCYCWDGDKLQDALLKDAYALIHEQQEQLKVSRWISVEDRLPENKQIVVVSDGIHTWDVGQYSGLSYIPGGNYKKDFWNWKKNTVKTVKWWMPKECALPKPPQEED